MFELQLEKLAGCLSEAGLSALEGEVALAHKKLYDPAAPGADFTGWVRLPVNYDHAEFARIQKAAEKIRSDSQVLVVIGIGGSYLGAKAALEVFPSNGPEICFAGCSLSPNELKKVMNKVKGKDWSINVISKSGGTTEPAVAFRLFRALLEKQYGVEADRRIYATTDKARGALKSLADTHGWESFVIPDEVGGRYSVLTAVGLLPIAVGGTDISALMAGAAAAMEEYDQRSMANPVWRYAAARNALYRQGKKVEIFCNYEPSYSSLGEWLKQLFGESEGKSGKGVFPASVDLTPDLHSMGQYMQQGLRMLQETVVFFDQARARVEIPTDADNLDGLNYLAGKTMDYVNEVAMKATKKAHIDGGVPVTEIRVERICEETVGALIYFFEFACGVSGYISGVNPFNQPGVEAYKTNMFEMLGKPGYEKK